jgi:hypothetical protein
MTAKMIFVRKKKMKAAAAAKVVRGLYAISLVKRHICRFRTVQIAPLKFSTAALGSVHCETLQDIFVNRVPNKYTGLIASKPINLGQQTKNLHRLAKPFNLLVFFKKLG